MLQSCVEILLGYDRVMFQLNTCAVGARSRVSVFVYLKKKKRNDFRRTRLEIDNWQLSSINHLKFSAPCNLYVSGGIAICAYIKRANKLIQRIKCARYLKFFFYKLIGYYIYPKYYARISDKIIDA